MAKTRYPGGIRTPSIGQNGDALTIEALVTIPLAQLPEYADQAAAAAALAPGRLFRFATTGAIGVALT